MQRYFSTALTACAVQASLKVGIVSDLHTNLGYDATASDSDNCVASATASANGS